MIKLPFISICIPTYNGSAYLSEALNSALPQSFTDFEVLVVDDNSTDNTLEIANRYAALDTRIRVLKNSHNLGLVANWNRCIELARGEWIKFLFQDDLMAPECLERMINYREKSKDKEKIIFCRRNYFFENIDNLNEHDFSMNNTQFFWDFFPNKSIIKPRDTIGIIFKWPARNIFGEPSSCLIHKEVFKQFGMFDPSFHHICDLEYWLRIGVNLQVLLINENLIHFRLHEHSTSNLNRRDHYLQLRYLERIKLFRKFMYDDKYKALRDKICSWPCNMYLRTQTAIFARRAKIAVKAKADMKWYKTFASFLSEYSDIAELINANFFILAIRYLLSMSCLKIKWIIKS